MKEADRAPSPAEYILVVPEDFLKKVKLTNDIGFYYLILPGRIVDKDITLYYCNSKESLQKKRISILEPQISKIENDYVYYVESVVLDVPCSEAVENESVMYQQLALLQQKPEETGKLLGIGTVTASSLPIWILALPGGAGAAADGDGAPSVPVRVIDISDQDIPQGKLLSYSLSAFSDKMGFNFVPKRDIGESVFWNSSAISMAFFNQISAYSNFENYSRVSAAFTVKDVIGFGIGYMYLKQEEKRTGLLETGQFIIDDFESKEDGIFLSASILLQEVLPNSFSVGITGKRIEQEIESPGDVAYINATSGIFKSWTHNERKNTIYDFDLSATYRLSNSVTLGATLMNIAGKKLIDGTGYEIPQRAGGIGGVYQWRKLQIGTDIICRESESAGLALGANFVPFNSALIYAGYDTTYHAYSVKAKYWWLSYTYNYNDVFGQSHFIGVNVQF